MLGWAARGAALTFDALVPRKQYADQPGCRPLCAGEYSISCKG